MLLRLYQLMTYTMHFRNRPIWSSLPTSTTTINHAHDNLGTISHHWVDNHVVATECNMPRFQTASVSTNIKQLYWLFLVWLASCSNFHLLEGVSAHGGLSQGTTTLSECNMASRMHIQHEIHWFDYWLFHTKLDFKCLPYLTSGFANFKWLKMTNGSPSRTVEFIRASHDINVPPWVFGWMNYRLARRIVSVS